MSFFFIPSAYTALQVDDGRSTPAFEISFFFFFQKIIEKVLFRIDVSNLHKNFHSLFAYETW